MISPGLSRLFPARRAVSLSLIALALFATACGSSGSGVTLAPEVQPAPAPETQPAPAADPAPAPDPVPATDPEPTGPAPDVVEEAVIEPAAPPSGECPPGDLPDPTPVAEGAPIVDNATLGPVGSELIITDLIEGDGDEAVAGATIDVQYLGIRACDGVSFDSSWSRGGQPFTFTLGVGQVISGWDQGFEGMKVGGRRQLQIPAALAYGDSGAGADIPPGADLIFVVDLENVTAPLPEPALNIPELTGDTQVVDEVLGDGDVLVSGDTAMVHILVALSDGIIIESTWRSGQEQPFMVGDPNLIAGISEGLEGMAVGGRRLVAVPAAVAFPEGLPPDIPEGETLIFLMEVLEKL